MGVADGEAAAQRRLRVAGVLARCGWIGVAVACGIALALAQYASLADGDPEPLERIALWLAWGGGGLAVLAWLWWALVRFRLWRAGYVPEGRLADSASGCLAFGFWLFLTVGGMIVMAVGGDADSTAPLALLALGGGCAVAIAGFLGLIRGAWRWYAAERREEQQTLAEVRAVAVARGWEMPTGSRGATALSGIGAAVSAILLLGCYAIAYPLADRLQISTALVSALIIAPSMAICFFSLLKFIDIQIRTREAVAPEKSRRYSYRAAAAVTIGLALIGILSILQVGFLSIIVIIALSILANRWRRQFLLPE